MGRLMGKGVPDLSWGPVRTTNHQCVASWVIEALEPSPVAVFLNHPHTSLCELVAQYIDGFPRHRMRGNGNKQWEENDGKTTPPKSKQRSIQLS